MKLESLCFSAVPNQRFQKIDRRTDCPNKCKNTRIRGTEQEDESKVDERGIVLISKR